MNQNVTPAVAVEYVSRCLAYGIRIAQVNRDVAMAVQDDHRVVWCQTGGNRAADCARPARHDGNPPVRTGLNGHRQPPSSTRCQVRWRVADHAFPTLGVPRAPVQDFWRPPAIAKRYRPADLQYPGALTAAEARVRHRLPAHGQETPQPRRVQLSEIVLTSDPVMPESAANGAPD